MIGTLHHDGSSTIVGIEHDELTDIWDALIAYYDAGYMSLDELERFGAIAGLLNRRPDLTAYRQVDTATAKLF